MNQPSAFLDHLRTATQKQTAAGLFRRFAEYGDGGHIVRAVLEECFTLRRTNSDVYGAVIGAIVSHGPAARLYAESVAPLAGPAPAYNAALYCHGECLPNPGGVMSWGLVVVETGAAVEFYTERGALQPRAHYTNVGAALLAIGKGLRWLESRPDFRPAVIYTCMKMAAGLGTKQEFSGKWAATEARIHGMLVEQGVALEWARLADTPRLQQAKRLALSALQLAEGAA